MYRYVYTCICIYKYIYMYIYVYRYEDEYASTSTHTCIYMTSRASVAQLVRARDCQSLGCRFDSV